MNKTSVVKFIKCVASVSLLAFWAGCGDDSSTAPEDQNSATNTVPASSSDVGTPDVGVSSATVPTEPVTTSSATVVDPSLSSADPVVASSASVPSEPVVYPTELAYAAVPISATPDEDGFYYVADVYKAIPATSKIAFVLRHSERQSCESQESKLTAEGIAHAQTLGKDIGGDEPFYYTSTDFIRTRETASNIAAGRGETAEVVPWDAINGSYFLKVPQSSFDDLVGSRGGSWKNMSQFIYGAEVTNKYVAQNIADYVYDIMPRGNQFVKEIVLDNMDNWKRVSFLITHDVLIEPLIVYATNRTIDLKFYESKRWANYMSGIAVVKDEAGVVSLYPVRGYEVGWIGATKSTSTCPEDEAVAVE